ncbi:MAG TPA: F0F1 ATP synthase subunit A, partial [Thermoanaerobaculia bacterium]|nr:F0F1 ATP synthase subunit A [Thermoanaerobaculia bacterium]
MMLGFLMMAADPLEHIVRHPMVQRPADLEQALGRVFGKVGGLIGWALTPEKKVTLFDNHIAMIILAGLLISLFLPMWARRRRGTDAVGNLVPAGTGNAIEAICVYLREEIARPNLQEHTDRFIKYIWTVFFFVLTLNVLGLLPISSVAPLFGSHIGGTATANVYVTAALAILTLIMMVVNG